MGVSDVEGAVNGVQSGAICGVAAGAPPKTTRCEMGGSGGVPPLPLMEAHIYRVSLPKMMAQLMCLVEGYWGEVTNRTNPQVQFAHHNVRETIVILEEGNRPYTRCPK